MDSTGSFDRFDRAFDAFGHKYRRRLLLALLDHNPQDETDAHDAEDAFAVTSDAGDDDALIELELVHTHLPKLKACGYITWDQDRGKISKGPNWSEIEPLLELLSDHADDLPEDWI